MTFLEMLQDAQRRNDSMLCVGLDPEPRRFPGALQSDPARIRDGWAETRKVEGVELGLVDGHHRQKGVAKRDDAEPHEVEHIRGPDARPVEGADRSRNPSP